MRSLMRAIRSFGLLPIVALVAAAGCNEYHYYDVSVTFNIASGQFAGTNEISTIQRCVLTVSGADSATLVSGLENGCPPMSAAGISTQMGISEFATFADSGQLTFTFAAYDDSTLVDACKTGQGVKTIEATSASTTSVALTVDKIAPGCVP
jgi:hypothetical protein